MECPRRRNITYKETGEIWFMTVRVMRFLPGMSRYFSSCILIPGLVLLYPELVQLQLQLCVFPDVEQ